MTTVVVGLTLNAQPDLGQWLNDWYTPTRLIMAPLLTAITVWGTTTASAEAAANIASQPRIEATATPKPERPFVAQIIGLQWINPLHRIGYSTEWQCLWTLGMTEGNKDDDIEFQPAQLGRKGSNIRTVKATGKIERFQQTYFDRLTRTLQDAYFNDKDSFYNVVSKGSASWRELAGIHVEYAIPRQGICADSVASYATRRLIDAFAIGSTAFPSVWSSATPPEVRTTPAGTNAGFDSLTAALLYLEANPSKTVWVMSWDSPNFPQEGQLNENMTLLILAGPDFDSGRQSLAGLSTPAKTAVSDFESEKGMPSRGLRAWSATLQNAARSVGKQLSDIGYVVHDAGNAGPDASGRIGQLAQTLTTEIPEFDFMKQTFNTAALLGDMGAGSGLTNIALAVAYANHMDKCVLVAGTGDSEHPTALVVTPPDKVRPIDPSKPWHRTLGEDEVYLPWWGLRRDAPEHDTQGFSK